jgi:hypothetical protein
MRISRVRGGRGWRGGGGRGEEEEGGGAHLQTPRGSRRAHGDRAAQRGIFMCFGAARNAAADAVEALSG